MEKLLIDNEELIKSLVKPKQYKRLDLSTVPASNTTVTILDFPENRQVFDFDCGSNAFQSILTYFGYDIREDKLMGLLKTDKDLGTETHAIVSAAKRYELATLEGRFTINDLKVCINKGWPVLICLQAWAEDSTVDLSKSWDDGHYVICIGYTSDKIIFEDPSSVERTYLTFKELDDRWHDIGLTPDQKLDHWGCVFYGKKPKFQLGRIVHMD